MQEKLLDLNASLLGGLKWIFAILIKPYFLLSLLIIIIIFILSSLLSFFLFIFDFQSYFLNYFFICRLISDPSILIVHPQHRLFGNSSRQLDPSLLAPYFSTKPCLTQWRRTYTSFNSIIPSHEFSSWGWGQFFDSSALFCNFQYFTED